MRSKWGERPRDQRWAVVGAFIGMAFGAAAVFEFAYDGTTFDRYLIMAGSLLAGGAAGLVLARVTAR